MPQLIYRRDGLEDRVWTHEPKKLLSPEVITIEKLTGMRFPEWETAVQNGSIIAIHAYLYVLLKRDEPTLTPSNVVFSSDQVDIELTDEETDEVRDKIMKEATERPLNDIEKRLLDAVQRDWEKRHPDGEDTAVETEPATGPGLPAPTGEPDPKDTPTG
jgi:hypothetical protein